MTVGDTEGEARAESLLHWIGRLICDPRARARLADDPVAVLTEHGLLDLDPDDVRHALVLVAEAVGARLEVGPAEPPPGIPITATPITATPITSAPSRRTS